MFIIRLGFQIVNIKLEIFIKNFSMIYSYIYIQAGQPPATYKGVFIMHDFNFEMNQYLTYCRTQKRLDGKSVMRILFYFLVDLKLIILPKKKLQHTDIKHINKLSSMMVNYSKN